MHLSKCDETAPICRECSSAGLECSGPQLGSIFIDMSYKIKRSHDKKRAKAAPTSRATESLASWSATETAPCAFSSAVSNRTGFEFQLPTTYAPNAGLAFQQLYLLNLIGSHSSLEGQIAGLHTWIGDLPQMLSTGENRIIVHSCRATSMALYGRQAKNENLTIQARRCYATCLRFQKQSFQCNVNQGQESSNTSFLATIAAIYLLGVFESITSTTPDGWMHHFSAGTKMLLLKGPRACQTGLGHQLFRSLRISSVRLILLHTASCPPLTDITN